MHLIPAEMADPSGEPKSATSLISKVVNGQRRYYVVRTVKENGRDKMIGQVPLGTLESILKAKAGPSTPDHAVVLEFGAAAALLDLAERLGLREIVNTHSPARISGPTTGDLLLLAAIHRALAPGDGQARLGEWFERTVLVKSFPEANHVNLGGHVFLESVAQLGPAKVEAIGAEVAAAVLDSHALDIMSSARGLYGLFRVDAIGKAILERGARDGREQDKRVAAHGLAFMLSRLLVKLFGAEVRRLGHTMTVPRALRSLEGLQQVVNVHHFRHRVEKTYAFSRLRGLAREYCDKFDLKRYALP